MMDVRRFVDDAAQCADDDDGDRSGDDGGYDTSDSFINDSVDSAQEDDFDVEMTGDALGRRHSARPTRYTDTEHAAQLREVLSDDDEFAGAAGTAGSDEDDDIDHDCEDNCEGHKSSCTATLIHFG
jgi:hypothetical protein